MNWTSRVVECADRRSITRGAAVCSPAVDGPAPPGCPCQPTRPTQGQQVPSNRSAVQLGVWSLDSREHLYAR